MGTREYWELDKTTVVDIASSFLRCLYASNFPNAGQDEAFCTYTRGKVMAYGYVLEKLGSVRLAKPEAEDDYYEGYKRFRPEYDAEGKIFNYWMDDDILTLALQDIKKVGGEELLKDVLNHLL